MKPQEIMAEPKSGRVFGEYLAHLGVVEFQKRGYPHAHLLYALKKKQGLTNSTSLANGCGSEFQTNVLLTPS